ncbi:MarR family transcriptional regulator [Streptomyces radiopugnans]|uniref:DNA-binding transcriptional regulator, MarR family n=1 Tax=Streptomyces radiopugnans TaxID=403935 RepID=A0A1H9J6A5_9ACTN|nr:DNA-binding transcriptional regulator, MarR family [Streptomyces radiopugnans]
MRDSDDPTGGPTGEPADAPAEPSDAPGGDPTGLQAFAVLLRRMNGEFSRTAHDFAHSHGLHPTDVQALVEILDSERDGPVTPGLLRERLQLTSGAVTACLDRLERAGHIRRTRDSADRRIVHLHYAPRGREVAREYFRPLARATDSVRQRFSDAELRAVVRFLAAMNEELAALRHRPDGDPARR